MTAVPTVELPSGDALPTVGVGTWNIEGETVKQSVRAALAAGYTHIDTAEGYFNEEAVGAAIEDADREALFLTSKVLPKHLAYESVIESCEASLERLGTDYLDLYLVHWANPAVSMRETFAAMATLVERGLVRNVGVSNFSAYQLSCAQHVSDVPIAVNQIEFHPYFQRPELVEFCRDSGTVIEAAAPLARGEILEDPVLTEIADAHDRSPAQVVLRWALDRGMVVMPKSSKPERVRENIDLFEWSLTEAERTRIDDCARNEPVYDVVGGSWESDVWGISQ
jgi:diketogulonate reductase-like aldo/keto reductase